MLINFLEEKVIIRNFFSKDKTVIFLLVKNDNIPERTLEKLITLYLMKCAIVNDENDFKKMHIFLYISNHMHISSVDNAIFKKIYFYYDGCIHIKKIHEADIWVKKYFIHNVSDFSFNININFDKNDYDIYRRTAKRAKRLHRLRKSTKINKTKQIANFFISFFGTKRDNLTLQLQS